MPTLFVVQRYRVVIFTNDHAPPHVHVLGPGGKATFRLGSNPNMVKLVETYGIKDKALRLVAGHIIDRHRECRARWREIHGD